MQDIVFYAAANETLGIVRDYANSRNEYAPTLVLGVSVCLRMRLFAGSESTAPYPVTSFNGITSWKWRMDADFDRETPYKLTADSNGISVQTVTDTIDGETLSFTEFAIQISDMNTQELATWLGTEKKKTGLTGELVGYDSSGNAVFVLQIDDFTVRNRLAGLNEPTSNDQEYLTRSETENLVSSAAAAKQDKLTSANAGAGIAIDSGGTISMACAIFGATNGVQIVDGMAQFDVTTAPVRGGTVAGVLVDVADGLKVTGGTASIDDASVQDVLVGIKGGTTSINDEVVTPGNLRGALSIGQAVDVSCKPYNNSGSIVYVNDDFLQGFTATMVAGTTVGFYDTGSHKFPKFAKDGNGNPLHYIFLMDVTGTGAITWNGQDSVTLSNTPQRISAEITAANTGFFSAAGAATVSVANWRQYEVNALTEEAKAYLMSGTTNPNPDALFRNTSVYGVLNKYLVKQDMVAPWIPTIGMSDNSDLTVAAGLSYKIKYTNDSAHLITVDTIPADAYGWDAHIQMFVKGTAAVQFQPPLVLMDALTPNAGHNLSVKFRNGQALVYVEDINAGYIVVSPTGTTSGTLNYGLVTAPTDEKEDKYIIFGSTVNGLVCDFGTVTPVYGAQSTAINLIGNGSDQTFISGTLAVPSGKTVNMQDMTIAGSTANGSGTVNIRGARLTGDTELVSGSTMAFSGTDELDGTLSGSGVLVFDANSVLTTSDGTGEVQQTDMNYGEAYDGAVIDGLTFQGAPNTNKYILQPVANASATVRNCKFVGPANVQICMVSNVNASVNLIDCKVTGTTGRIAGISNTSTTDRGLVLNVSGCTFSDVVGGSDMLQAQNGTLNVTNCLFENYRGSALNLRITGASMTITGTTFGFPANASSLCLNASDNQTLDSNGVAFYLSIEDSILNKAAVGLTAVTLKGNNRFDAAFTSATRIAIVEGSTISGPGPLDAVDRMYITEAVDGASVTAIDTTLKSPLDASAAATVQLSGATFTSGSFISGQPARIQLPAGTTVSFSGNTNSSDTKILQATVMVVGDNAAAPSGSVTIAYVGGSTNLSGIGTYVAKDGSNDFTAISNVKSVTVSSGASTVASSLASALALTTSSGGINRWVKLANNLTATAVFTDTATVTDKRIITAEYEPVLAGNFSFSGGAVMTVDEAARMTTVASGTIVMSSVEIPSGATVRISGGSLTIEHVSGDGGTIELAGSNAFQLTSGTIGRMTISSGAIVDLASGIVTGKSIVRCGGASLSPTMIVCGGSSRIFEDVEIHGTTISDHGIICGATVYSNVGDDHYIYSTEDDGATSSSVIVTGATEYVVPGGLVRVVGT